MDVRSAYFFASALERPPHESWDSFLNDPEVVQILCAIEAELKSDLLQSTPIPASVLRFLQLDLTTRKIIIIGQDPYPQANAATGRCFEVGTLDSWEQPFRNVSLKNIVRAIYKADRNCTLPYKEVIKASIDGWPLLPPSRLFKDWEQQGVLLLNTAFTTIIGQAGSHVKIWEPFTDLLLQYIAKTCPHLIWFLWGKHAENIAKHVDIQHKYVSQHPMMCYEREHRTDDFLFGSVSMFAETKHIVKWQGADFSKSLFDVPKTLFG